MAVKDVVKGPDEPAAERPRWVRAEAVMTDPDLMTGWFTNENSVRNAARQKGKFRCRRADHANVLLYDRQGVVRYRRELEAAGLYKAAVAEAPSAMAAPTIAEEGR